MEKDNIKSIFKRSVFIKLLDIPYFMFSDDKIELCFNENDTIHWIKSKIEDNTKISKQCQILRHNGKELRNEHSLKECYVKKDDTLKLSVKDTIFVRRLSLENFAINAIGTDTIQQFKQKIQDMEGIPPCQMELVYHGQELLSGTLSDNGIRNGDTVYLILRLRGS